MAMAVAVGAGPKDLDLGGSQELAHLVPNRGLGLVWLV